MPAANPFAVLDRAQHPQRRHVRHRAGPVEEAAPPVWSLPRDMNARQQLVEVVITRLRHYICIAHTYFSSESAYRPDQRAFCPQACYAGGPGRFRYLLDKDVNRHAKLSRQFL